MTSGQSRATPRSTTGCALGRISARNCSGVGATPSVISARAPVRDELIRLPFPAAGVDPFGAKLFDVGLEALGELCFFSRTFRAPGYFRQGKHAWERHELQIALRGDELRPYARFDAQDPSGLFRREAIRHRFPR